MDRTTPDERGRTPAWGYADAALEPGRHDISVTLPVVANEAMARALFARRASDVCGGAYEANVYEASRPTLRYETYGGMPGGPVMRGLVTCAKPAEAAAVDAAEVRSDDG